MVSLNIEETKELIKKDNASLQFESFAFKILLQQLRTQYLLKKNEKTLSEATKKVAEFFEKMKSLDSVKRDYKKIYGRELNG